jgi:beta-galactosidase beta subunit
MHKFGKNLRKQLQEILEVLATPTTRSLNSGGHQIGGNHLFYNKTNFLPLPEALHAQLSTLFRTYLSSQIKTLPHGSDRACVILVCKKHSDATSPFYLDDSNLER